MKKNFIEVPCVGCVCFEGVWCVCCKRLWLRAMTCDSEYDSIYDSAYYTKCM